MGGSACGHKTNETASQLQLVEKCFKLVDTQTTTTTTATLTSHVKVLPFSMLPKCTALLAACLPHQTKRSLNERSKTKIEQQEEPDRDRITDDTKYGLEQIGAAVIPSGRKCSVCRYRISVSIMDTVIIC